MATEADERTYGSQSMIASLRQVLVHMPSEEYNQEGWDEWGFAGSPDRELARQQHSAFVKLLEDEGVGIDWLEEHSSFQTTATYDPAIVTNEGAVMMRSGRSGRWPEVFPMARKLLSMDIPIIGWIRGEGRLDGGDTLWLDGQTLLVGQGYRSNVEGYRQLQRILDGAVEKFHHFELPHWDGPSSVLHLMSVVNLCSEKVALVYPRAIPIGLMSLLKEREFTLVECPEDEFNTQGCNVLTIRPGVVVMCAGNTTTAGRLRDAGIEVLEYEGSEISIRRISGPTCNTRPLLRT